jgi:hypothetical protein
MEKSEMNPTPRFIQGAFRFEGRGFASPYPLDDRARYLVPADKRAQLIYMRGGNSSDALVCLILTRDGTPMRYFPIGAKASVHVPLAVVEDLFPESKLEVLFAAPEGAHGTVIVDFGILESD